MGNKGQSCVYDDLSRMTGAPQTSRSRPARHSGTPSPTSDVDQLILPAAIEASMLSFHGYPDDTAHTDMNTC